MVLITVSRKQRAGKAPLSATAGKGNGRRGFSRDIFPALAPYLLLTSVLYRIMAATITITPPSNMNGCMPDSYLNQAQKW